MAQERNFLGRFDSLWDNADVMEEILWLCFLGSLGARSLNIPLALYGIWPRSSSAPALERKQPSSAGGLGGDSSSVLSLLHVLCDVPALQAVLVLLSALRNEGYEMCSAGSSWRRQLISQADREICKLKMAYRSLFTAHRMKPRPGHPYICAQRLSE